MVDILIVEDDPSLQVFISRILERWGFDVKVVGDGESIFEILETAPPTCVMLDMNLPWVPGVKLCKIIKKASPEIKVIAMTGDTRPKLRKDVLSAGADAFILKPFEIPHLEETICKVLGPICSPESTE